MIAPASGVAPFRFSTDDVRPCDRTAVWREVLGRVHLHLDVEQVGDGPLHATVESHRWSSASLDFRLLRADGAGYHYVSNGVDHVVDDGCSALLFNGVVGSVRYLGPCRVTAIRLRRADLASAMRGFDDRAIRHVEPQSRALRLLAGYVDLLRRQGPTADPLMAGQVANHLTDLVALALGATGDAAEIAHGRGLRAARLSAIKADIVANLANPDLSIAAVAARHGVTPRYVGMLFESEGSSFTDFVLEQRLYRAHRTIADPRHADRMISAIAFAAGFGDLSYFNRTFRRRFGMTPSDLRARARN